MADQKLTDLTADTAPTVDDLIYTVTDPAGTPLDRKVAIIDLLNTLIGPQPPCARLTTESGVPVSTTDRTAQSTIYWTPYNGSKVWLYTNSKWTPYSLTEISLALSGLTSGKNYDVFVYDNAGTLTLELSAAWTNDTTRADALALQNGMYVKSGATTRLWIGTIRTTGTTTTEDSAAKRFVWNTYAQVQRLMTFTLSSSHTYNTNTWRYWNNASSSKVEFVIGINSGWVDAGYVAATESSNQQGAAVGALVNWTSGDPGAGNSTQVNGAFYVRAHSSRMRQTPILGYNYIAFLEWAENATKTFYDMYGRSIILN